MEDKYEREEGEMTDEDELMSVDEEPPSPTRKTTIAAENDYALLYRSDKQGLIVEKLEKPDCVKLEGRARRFGNNLSGDSAISQKQIDELYKDLGIDESNERHIQFDTVYLKGVDGLTTNEIFNYLKEYNPVSVHRTSKSSCNVLCKDHISAALAILVNSREIIDEAKKTIANRNKPYHWREGQPHPYSDLILMRFATHSDTLKPVYKDSKNTPAHQVDITDSSGKNPWGDLCKSWGVYDHQEVYGPKLPPKSYIKTEAGIIRKHRAHASPDRDTALPRVISTNLARRLGKRQFDVESPSDESNSDDEWKKKSKVPRMRMRADDEEKKRKSVLPSASKPSQEEDPYPSLSIQIENTNDESLTFESGISALSEKFSNRLKSNPGNSKVNIQSRLGERVVSSSDSESSDESSASYQSEVNLKLNVMSRVQRAPERKEKKTMSSVWTRLDKTGAQTDLRQTLKKTKTVTPSDKSDLRAKLKEKRRSPLRIEIDNEYYESD